MTVNTYQFFEIADAVSLLETILIRSKKDMIRDAWN